MARFDIAIVLVRYWEGGYSNRADDKGGETYAGISRKHNPHWPGWAAVDAAKPLNRYAIVPAAEPHVNSYYEAHYWPKIKGDDIADQRVAGFLFDWYVNSGAWATRAVQRMVGVTVDGKIGPKTVAAINAAGPGLFGRLQVARVAFVHGIVRRDPKQRVNLAGWLRRINSFQ
ncbi:glycosyl hydrolase 108 family protein [Chitinophaga sp.]|uniref:glycoside hydrolase family 108 protein n=1 Tax=Chitinophaga sp. TaxID=1869181 RepID=UPI0031D63C84